MAVPRLRRRGGSYAGRASNWPVEAIDAAFEHWELGPDGRPGRRRRQRDGTLTSAGRAVPAAAAVEPVDAMGERNPVGGGGRRNREHLPLDDGSVQAIFVGEAFHGSTTARARRVRAGPGRAAAWRSL